MGMAEDRTTITLSELVRRATAIVDADGADDADEILALAARSEFDGRPPEGAEAWLERNGIEV
jgi:hypothetical protein